jgi:16S rRNA (guanine966-N2)-methyltransferase
VTRIVAGLAGGRRLSVPPKGTRPTADRVREALFSAIDAVIDLDGARVLDLYAGSGALGLEALSRGAAVATLVEFDRNAVRVLKANVVSVGLEGAQVLPGKVAAVLGAPPEAPYDLVFADPPYALGEDELAAALTALVEQDWTTAGSTVIVERDRRSGPPRWPAALTPERSRRYGETELHWATR